MCGIAGVYAHATSADPVDRGELRAVRDHMAARGPDGSGEWFSDDGRVGLGHRRLSIIDLSEGGAQPKVSANGQVVISFNGEIYNYKQLRRELQSRGRVFTSGSDTEVLLQLYEEHGTAMLGMLRGMFAFALWDSRKRAMLLARDAFGIKPLYYANDGKTMRVASQVKALLRSPVDTRPEPAGHAGFFLWGSVPAPWTLYRGIRNLVPGHFMWVDEQGAHEPQAWCVISDILAQAAAEPARGTESQALEAIAAALNESVQAHLVADLPVGILLSGGIDSAMITSMVSATGARPRTVTLGFAEYEGTPRDERPLAEAVARQFGTRHSAITVRRSDFENEREKLLAAMDQPSIDGVNTWFVARAAASQGLKVAVLGLGGDELFGKYPSFRDVPRLAKCASAFNHAPRAGVFARLLSEPLLRHVTSPKYAGLLEYGGSLGGAYLLRRGLYMPWELPRLMDPDMARAGWQDLQTIARLQDTTLRIQGRARNRLAVSALEMSWYMRHQLLNDADWAGMAQSVEIRLPLVDVHFLKAAAPWVAAFPSLGKQDVAHAVAPELPDAILHKKKTGFVVPVREWLGASAESTRGLRGWSRLVHERAPKRKRQARVMISTLAPANGGVSAMTKFVIRNLAQRGYEPVIAHYAPYSLEPRLSVPSYRLLQRVPGAVRRVAFDCETHAMGAWLPELEFTHYAATPQWRKVMDSCDAFVAVSGNVLAATPFWQSGRHYLAWVATDWEGDHQARASYFPLVRRWLDRCVNAPVIRRLEKKLLTSGDILPLSDYTSRVLADIADRPALKTVLPVAVDTSEFVPAPQARMPGRIGFAGRFNDPRKNIGLLLGAVAQLRTRGSDVSLTLMGEVPETEILDHVARLQLKSHVAFRPGLSRAQMRDLMQTLDVFVLPSHQEGLCIAALEAMACGVPVVSTRCGGPEEFVIPGQTGLLVDSRPSAMADAIASILDDEVRRNAMGASARQLIQERYGLERMDTIFTQAFKSAFPQIHGRRPAHEHFVPIEANESVA